VYRAGRVSRATVQQSVVALALVLTLTAACWAALSTATETRSRSAATGKRLPVLTVKGNHVMRRGKPFRFHGVNRDSLEWGRNNWGGCGGDGHFRQKDFDLIKSWTVTALRLPLSQAGWLGRSCEPASYARAVERAVAAANARGMYAILDLHWTDVEGRAPCEATCLTGQQPMPDADSLRFWAQVARRFKDAPGVIFGLFNEPHDVPWGCWRDGGCEARSVMPELPPSAPAPVWRDGVAYRAVGMQQLYDTIRAQGARNLVLVGGLDWAYDLSGVAAGYALKGRNIAYDSHVYTQFHFAADDWDRHFGSVAARYPVVSTEFGSADCSTAVTKRLLRYFEAPAGDRDARMSWMVWSWNNPGSCTQPSVLADWEGTPLPGQGRVVKRALAAASP
jgi:endoglucanase